MKNISYLLLSLVLISCHAEPSAFNSSKDYSTAPAHWDNGVATEFLDLEEEIEIVPQSSKEDGYSAKKAGTKTAHTAREVIKTADYKLQVTDLEQTTAHIHTLAEEHDAFVSGMNLNSSATMVNNIMTIRVPNANFEKLLTAISNEAIFTNHKKIYSQDVTEEFVDLKSRLKVKKEIKEKYEQILRNDAKSLSQIFEAEEKIRVLQEEIEAKEGRLRYLSNQVNLSEIKLEIYQQVEYQAKLFVQNKSFFQKSKDSFLTGWASVQVLLLGALDVWPLLLLIGALWFNRKYFTRRLKLVRIKKSTI